MKALHLSFSLLLFCSTGKPQNILKNKLEGCPTPSFCLDCGDPKASFKQEEFRALLQSLDESYRQSQIGVRFAFQMYIDSVGSACAIAYDGELTPEQAKQVATKLSGFKGWVPAVQDGKPITVSVLVVFDFTTSAKGLIRHLDYSHMEENMNNPGTPEIQNKRYRYKNKNLKDYEFTLWDKHNSDMPYDMARSITVDKSGVVWEGTDNALVRFHKDRMITYNKTYPAFQTQNKFMTIDAAATDLKNHKWFSANGRVIRYNSDKWEAFDSTQIGIKGARSISVAPSGKIYFCDFRGVAVYDDGKWSHWTPVNSKLPSEWVSFANEDAKGRIWIGTYKGSVMLEGHGQATLFNEGETPLKNLCITDMAEERDGTLWFATSDYAKKASERLVKLSATGEWSYYDISNSGLPANHINKIVVDAKEDVLWISVHNVGLVRFDKKENWQVYTNKNSGVPSVYIFDMEQDREGNLWCATFSGLLRVSKKQK